MTETKYPPPRGPLHKEAIQAMREAVWGVIQDAKLYGRSLVVMRDGQIVEIPAEEAEKEYLAEAERLAAAEKNGTNGVHKKVAP